MLARLDVKNSAVEKARQLLLTAFSGRNKPALKLVQRALKLAEQRGYKNVDNFQCYFRNQDMHTPKLTEKWVMGFFEYVSADEFCQLANLDK